MVNGRLFDAATMNELGNHPRQRAKLFFEVEGNEAWGPTTSQATHHHGD
jgi:hypothetical protein